MLKIKASGILAAALSASAVLAAPQTYETPEAAVSAVVAALEARDRSALLAVLGPESEDVIISGNDERDHEDREDFLAAYEQMHRVAIDSDGVATLYVGREQWPFPLRLVKGEAGWIFDVEGGREEMLDRRIGRNELDVIDLLRAYVRVQSRFRQTDYDRNGVMEFAASMLSSPGARDGLYWPPEPGAPESLIGDAVAEAAAEGYVVQGHEEAPKPYLGYYFHLLQKQGPNAPGGALDYMINGNMVAGHAMLAFPADYGETGIMSFLVGENGIVYEADLGEDTIDIANAIEAYDPDDAWEPVEEEAETAAR
jgi:Protein of unknown function (DUF2950)